MTHQHQAFSHDLDQKIICEIKDVLQDDYLEVIDEYIEDCRIHIANIEEGIKLDNTELIVNNAHPLKSSSGGIGATGLYEAARTVEIETKKHQDTQTAINLIGEIKQLFSIYSDKLKAAG